ncbi:hypothetical protein B0H63DRAFT_419958 [Podospora didyma]|uniref:rRNA-processing protein EFG1 n=1 Tax=Podospora didyma TaxID=330526 RepID=A0AAE0KEI4_9PEZI|nr:hypothetical protein B0H63DRAFT_419958 [Podospora didyma]
MDRTLAKNNEPAIHPSRLSGSKKRPHAEAEDNTAVAYGERARSGPSRHNGHNAKRAKVIDDKMSSIKKRARAIERLLARDISNIPANVQNDMERELAAHKQRIAEDKERRHRSEMIGKYHMVRFFERQKAIRLAKQQRKKLTQLHKPEEEAKLKHDLHVAEVDVDYAIYFPFLERYISLYAAPAKAKETEAKAEKPTAVIALHIPRPPIWYEIEKAREEGKIALEKIQNRQSEQEAPPKPAFKKQKVMRPPAKNQFAAADSSSAPARFGAPSASATNRRERRAAMRKATGSAKAPVKADTAAGDGNDSDGGGFFEAD